MVKILKINLCGECPFFQGGECWHAVCSNEMMISSPEGNYLEGRKVENPLNSFPDWCPLEDF